MQPSSIKVLLADDHTLFRKGLEFLISSHPEFEVIGEATDGLEAVKMTQQLNPDVVLLDIDMPIMRGIEALPLMINHNPDLTVLMLTVSENSKDLTEALRLGARGFLLKNVDTEFLVKSIHQALEGDNVLSPEMTTKLIHNLCASTLEDSPKSNLHESLTPREKEILYWIVQGASNKVIARKLDITESTVKVHVQNTLRKLELTSRVQAAIYAMEHGLDTLP
ncbi:response regulator [Ignatzschineria sp. LJL83]